MSIEFRCPNCSKMLRVPDGSTGRRAECPQCMTISTVSDPTAGPSAAFTAAQSPPKFPDTFPGSVQPAQFQHYGSQPPAVANPFADRGTANPVYPARQGATLSDNPYVASSTLAHQRVGPYDLSELASPGVRLVAFIVEGLISFGGALPGAILAAAFEEDLTASGQQIAAFGMFTAFVGYLAVRITTWTMIAYSGQSISKRLFHIRIVSIYGHLPGFGHGVVLRNWVPALINWFFCYLFLIVDVPWIFSKNRQCLHDKIASTVVIRADAYKQNH